MKSAGRRRTPLAEELDRTLSELKGFHSARQSIGRIWVAQVQRYDHPPLRVIAEELGYHLERRGFRVEASANEPVCGGAAPSLFVLECGSRGQPQAGEQLIIVPRNLLALIRSLKFQIDQIDLRDPSYDNVMAFYQLVQQSLFLVRRGST